MLFLSTIFSMVYNLGRVLSRNYGGVLIRTLCWTVSVDAIWHRYKWNSTVLLRCAQGLQTAYF